MKYSKDHPVQRAMNATNNSILAELTYRPDIDGLRAIAVLSVVLFHAFPGWFKGGYFGVDIFFVISGFLITGIIVKRLENGDFSFVDFYSRRIRRIFPALGLVLAASMLFGWLVLLPNEYKLLGKHVAGGAGFILNFQLWQELGYFDTDSALKPLLHLWSLGVEEQFYIVCPFVIYWLWRRNSHRLIWALSLILLLSFSAHIALISLAPEADFYLPFTRFWELLVGSVLFCVKNSDGYVNRISLKTNKPTLWRVSREALSWAGLLMMIGPIFLLKEAKWNFFPVIGVFIVIATGPDSFLSRRLLSNPLPVLIGLISFPLYLWHWPLLSFAQIIEAGTPARGIRVALVVISPVLAWLTYKLIEQPLRCKNANAGTTRSIVICPILFLGICGYVTYYLEGFPSRLDTGEARAISLASVTDKESALLAIPEVAENLWKHDNKTNAIVLLGDSHAGMLGSGLKMMGVKNLVVLSHGTCLPFVGINTYRLEDTTWGVLTPESYNDTGCRQWVDSKLREIIRAKGIYLVILATYYNHYIDGRTPITSPGLENSGTREIISQRMIETIAALNESGKKVVMALDVPEFMEPCLPRRPYLFTKQSRCEISRKMENEKSIIYSRMIESVARRIPNVIVYDPRNVLCDEETCYAKKGGSYLYMRDGNHLTVGGKRLIGEDLEKHLNLPKYD